MDINPSVCCVIVLFNPDILELKKTIEKIKKENIHTICVDNNSSNKSEMYDLDFNIIFLDNNFGIATAHNVGLKEAINKGFKFSFLLDQDSDISEDFFHSMINSFYCIKSEIDPNIVALSPVHFNKENNQFYKIRLLDLSFADPFSFDKELIKVQYSMSSGTLIDLDLINKNGFMREDYFIDYVDIEWGFRMYSFGFSIYVDRRITLLHKLGQNIKIRNKNKIIHSPFRRYYMVRNSIYMLRESYIPYRYSINQVYTQLLHSVYLFLFIEKYRFKYFKKTFRGIISGLLGFFGKN